MTEQERLDDLLDRWEEAREQGNELSASELCKDCPELIAEVAATIRDLKRTDWMFEPDEEDFDYLPLPPVESLSAHALVPASLTLDQFSESIVTSGVMTSNELTRFDASDAQDLAAHLLRSKQLTEYQAKLIAEGNTKGLVLGNYVILDKIGAGGMGQVFKARHKRMKRIVALKTLPEKAVGSATALERFHREVEAAARLQHPNIVTAFDADEYDEQHFLVMEHVDGCDLRLLVGMKGPMSVGHAVDCIIQAAKGLEYAHKKGVVHRDIKPANLLLDEDGTVKVLDMGLARMERTNGSNGFAITESELTTNGVVLGTVDYLAPEQALDTHSADGRSDIYSLGCTLHFLLTGKPVFTGSTMMAKMLAHREKEIPSLTDERDDVPERLETVYEKMIAKKPDERYASMTALLEDLESVATDSEDTWKQAAGSTVTAEPDSDLASRETSSSELSDTLVMPPAVEPEEVPEVVAESSGGGRRIFAGTFGVLLLAGFGYWLFGILFSVETPDGIIQVESNVPDIDIFVDNEKVVYVTDPKDNKKISVSIPKGAEMLRVVKEGFEADVKEFRLKTLKGPIRVSFVPLEKPADVGDQHRQVAEWVLGLGGSVSVATEQGDGVSTSAVEDLPDEAFTVFYINMEGVTDFSDDHLAELSHLCEGMDLNELGLYRIGVTDDGLAHLAALRSLNSLVLGGTKVTDEGIRKIVTTFSLTRLNCSGTPITDKALEYLEQLPKLESLVVHGTAITDEGLRHLPVHRNLYHLIIGGDQLTEAGVKHLAALTNLVHLELYEFKIGDQGIVGLGDLDKLEILSVYGCDISDAGVQAMSEQFPNLRSLFLYGWDITDAGLEHLSKLKKLDSLRLAFTDVTAQGVAELQKALPNCQIDYVADPHRQIAEWVLGVGGEIKLVAHTAFISAVENLPDEEFEVNTIRVDANSEFTDDQLAQLCRLCQGIDLGHMGLGGTAITDDGLPHLAGLSIDQLFLGNTEITNAGIEYVKKVRNLSQLSISETKVSDEGVRQVAEISTIGKLDLSNTPITDTALEHLRELSSLTGLNIISTKISDEGLQHLTVHRNLHTLQLWSTGQLTEAGAKHLAGLTNLRGLELTGFELGDNGIVELRNLNKLETLAFSKGNISDVGVKAISEQFPNLSSLALVHTGVTDAGLEHLQKLNKLSGLHLGDTKVTAKGVSKLQKALPNCKINWDGKPFDATSVAPMGNPVVSGDQHRRVAEWVLGIGGKVTLSLPPHDGKEYLVVKKTAELPEELFRVTSIEIQRGQEVDDGDLHHLEGLDGLGSIQINYSRFTDSGLQRICSHENLTTLHLHGCQEITDSGFRVIGKLTKLKDLALDNTSVEDAGIECVSSLRLSRLGLGGTSITDAGLVHVGRVTSLQFLHLGNTKTTDDGLEHLKTLKNLRELHLGSPKVTAKGVAKLQQSLPNCKITWNGSADKATSVAPMDEPVVSGDQHREVAEWAISVGGSVMTRSSKGNFIDHIDDLPNQGLSLLAVRLSNCNRIEESGFQPLELLSDIETDSLYLNSTKITDIGLQYVRGAKSLKQLNLNHAAITDDGLKYLKDLEQLSILYLKSTSITDNGLPHLEELESLTQLFLGDSSVTAKGIAKLQQALPDCKIEWNGNPAADATSVAPTEKTVVSGDQHKQVAEYVLGLGGTVTVKTGEDEITVPTFDGLPADAFKIHGIHVGGVSDFTDEQLAELCRRWPSLISRISSSRTNITDRGLEYLRQLPNLTSLNINGTKITDDGLRHLAVHRNLNILLATGCDQITDAGMKHLAGLTNLVSLEMLESKITDAGIVELGSMDKLESLSIPGTDISDAGVKAITQQFPNLSNLNIRYTNVTDAGLENLTALSNLNRLLLHHTEVTPQGISELQKALPACKIYWDGGATDEPPKEE